MSYIDGFVIPVQKNKVKDYRKIASKYGKISIEYGALHVMESVADDVKTGKLTSFPQSVKLKKNEVVVFSYIVYKSRRDRDRIIKKIMNDSRIQDMCNEKNMPFDAMRMFFGGFKPIVNLTA